MSAAMPKPVTLEGSCHCQRVKFTVDSCTYVDAHIDRANVIPFLADTPYPYMICHCHADTKTAGVFNCNIMGEYGTFQILQGEEFVKVYQAKMAQTEGGANEKSETKLSNHKRHFCSECASCLWAYDDRYPDQIHPFASAIDTPLPKPDDYCHIMTDFKLNHVEIPQGSNIQRHARYPTLGIAEWHKQHGIYGTYTVEQ